MESQENNNLYYIKKWVILSYVVMKYSGIWISGSLAHQKHPGTWQIGWNAETIINQQLS